MDLRNVILRNRKFEYLLFLRGILKMDKAKIIIAKIIVFVLICFGAYLLDSYVHSVWMPTQNPDLAVNQLQPDQEVFEEMREWQTIKNWISPVIWLVVIIIGVIMFTGNILSLFFSKKNERVLTENKPGSL